MNRRPCALLSIFLSAFFPLTSSAAPENASPRFQEFLLRYFETHDREYLPEAIRQAHSSGLFGHPEAVSPIVGFFGGMLKGSDQDVKPFVVTVNSLSLSPNERQVASLALWLCATPVCETELRTDPFAIGAQKIAALMATPTPAILSGEIPRTVQEIDFMWSYFSATGDLTIPRRFIAYAGEMDYEVTPNAGDPSDIRFLLFWSIRSKAIEHDAVFELLKTFYESTGKMRDIYKNVLKARENAHGS